LGICSRKTRTCFLTSGYSLTDNYTFGVSAVVYGSAMSIANGLAAPKPPSQVYAGLSVPGRYSTSGTVFTSPSRARDHGGGRSYTRTGRNGRRVGFPGRRTEPNLPDRSVRPTLRFGSESIFITGNFVKRLLTYLGKFGQSAEARM